MGLIGSNAKKKPYVVATLRIWQEHRKTIPGYEGRHYRANNYASRICRVELLAKQ